MAELFLATFRPCNAGLALLNYAHLCVCQMRQSTALAQYRERIIFLGKAIDEELGNQLVATMLYLDSESKKDITLYINCSGGDVRALASNCKSQHAFTIFLYAACPCGEINCFRYLTLEACTRKCMSSCESCAQQTGAVLALLTGHFCECTGDLHSEF